VANIGKVAQIAGLLALLAALAACNGKGIQDVPQDINVSPRSQEAYDPVYRDLENDPAGGKKQQQQ
jgi:predicted small lipoprotein YifL